MSAMFYTNRTVMVGTDLHKCNSDLDPHVVFVGCANVGTGRTGTVTADALPMIRSDFSNFLVPHVCVPLSEPALVFLALTNLGSSSKPFLKVQSVRAEGKALATAMSDWWGMNMNCDSPFAMPTGHTLSSSSVWTSPTLADWLEAVYDAALSSAIGWIIGKLAGGIGGRFQETSRFTDEGKAVLEFVLKQAWRWVIKPTYVDPLADYAEKAKRYVDKSLHDSGHGAGGGAR